MAATNENNCSVKIEYRIMKIYLDKMNVSIFYWDIFSDLRDITHILFQEAERTSNKYSSWIVMVTI